MEYKDLTGKTEAELKETLKDLKKDLVSVVQDILKGNEKNVKKPIALKKDIARVSTALNNMEESNE